MMCAFSRPITQKECIQWSICNKDTLKYENTCSTNVIYYQCNNITTIILYNRATSVLGTLHEDKSLYIACIAETYSIIEQNQRYAVCTCLYSHNYTEDTTIIIIEKCLQSNSKVAARVPQIVIAILQGSFIVPYNED